MAHLWTLALVLFAGHVCSASRIVGGSPTTIEQYPSIVQIDRMLAGSPIWSQACAGNILNQLNILTAAHCSDGWTYNGPHSRRIRSGTTFHESGGVITYVTSVLNHPTWNNNGYDGDVSIIRITTGLLFNSVTRPVAIILQGFELPDNAPVVHAGWGSTESGGWHSDELLDVTIFTVNHEVCKQRYEENTRYEVTENMICAGILDVGGKDACQGDSGGPLYFQDILVGIVSWGMGCADPIFPGMSTKVSSYTQWIVDNAV